MDSTRAAFLKFEMFDGVRQIDGPAFYIGGNERFIENLSGRTNKGVAELIFLIARLFSNEHKCSLMSAFTEYGPVRRLPKCAAPAIGG
ncbi:hypothetical protein AA0488_0467 [Kozakia baliensis NRIC 0488]|nr:hypothetical protein AA0488_0467 [Kozakia baliensis NRIC 0488]